MQKPGTKKERFCTAWKLNEVTHCLIQPQLGTRVNWVTEIFCCSVNAHKWLCVLSIDFGVRNLDSKRICLNRLQKMGVDYITYSDFKHKWLYTMHNIYVFWFLCLTLHLRHIYMHIHISFQKNGAFILYIAVEAASCSITWTFVLFPTLCY